MADSPVVRDGPLKGEAMNAGKCDSCSYNGPLMEFRNDLVEPELCPNCIRKAYMSLQIFVRTPAGKQALVKKIAEMNKPDRFTVRV
jgi:hypothetical protein